MADQVSAGRATRWTVVNILVVLYALFPVLWILSLSLKPSSSVKDGKLIPSQITFDNYKGIFQGGIFTSALINSIGIGLITTVIAVVVGGMAAYAVARLAFPGKRLLIGVALLFRTLDAFRIFDNIYVITGGSNNTGSVSILGYDNLFKAFNVGLGSAISVLIFLSVALIAFIFIKGFGAAAPGADDGSR